MNLNKLVLKSMNTYFATSHVYHILTFIPYMIGITKMTYIYVILEAVLPYFFMSPAKNLRTIYFTRYARFLWYIVLPIIYCPFILNINKIGFSALKIRLILSFNPYFRLIGIPNLLIICTQNLKYIFKFSFVKKVWKVFLITVAR